MNPKYADYLFTELIIKASNEKENYNEIMHELMDRLIFCGFNLELAHAIIELEQIIVKNRNLKFKKRLYDTYWWIDNYESNIINNIFYNKDINNMFLSLNKDFFKNKKLPTNLLSLSEMISLEDEASYIDITYNDIPKKIKKEIDFFKLTKDENCNDYSLNEHYFRVMASYELIYKNYNYPEKLELISKRFYLNERNILFSCKWIYKLKLQYKKIDMWKSYTKEYFERYE